MALGLAHALVVAPRYHVGSFDDDASYVLAARAVASGHGLTSRLAGGSPLIGVYPPGYPALLSPLAAIWPGGVLAFRVLSLVLFAAIFPLAWVYLGRRGVPEPVRLGVLVLLALNPVLATYATMVMPEVAFVVLVLVLVLFVDRWQQERSTITWAGAGTLVCVSALPWVKEAGIGLVVGVAAWLALRRLFGKALLAAAVPALALLPLVLVRARLGAALLGSRYSGDLGAPAGRGLVARALHAARTYVGQAVPRSIVPTGNGLLPPQGAIGTLWPLLAWSAAPLVVVGFVVWCRRHPDAACLAVPVYLAETLAYPYTNERRLVLVLPLIVAWYVLGAASVFAAVRSPLPGLGKGVAVFACALAALALGSQFTRDYLYFEGASSSAPGGSGYMALLHQLGPSQQVVETDYLWTTALYSGHRTANGAYLAGCQPGPVAAAIASDGAGFLLTASLNGGGPVDDACLLPVVAGLPGAVRLFRSAADQASVFELIGPGTGHPETRDLVAAATLNSGVVTAEDRVGRYPTLAATGGAASLTWSWSGSRPVSQISLGAAAMEGAHTGAVVIEMRSPGGTWHPVASSPGPVGADRGRRYLLALFPSPVPADAVRVTVGGQGTAGVHDLHVLGPAT